MGEVANRGVFGRDEFAAVFDHAVVAEEAAVRIHAPAHAIAGLVYFRANAVLHQAMRGSQAAGAGADDCDFGLAAAGRSRKGVLRERHHRRAQAQPADRLQKIAALLLLFAFL